MKSATHSILRLLACLMLLAFAAAPQAFAFKIEEVTSPGGIKAWLVHDPGIPLIAMNFSFRGGSSLDPVGKEGVATFITGMMDEGAGKIDSATFQKRQRELSFKMSFSAGLDYVEGTFQTLSRNSDQSFELLRMALTSPRFDPEPLERMRRQFITEVNDKKQDPESIAANAWFAMALPGDPYTRDADGTEASLATITSDDLRKAHQLLFNKASLQVAVVGDIDAERLKTVLDEVFGGLPEGSEPPALPPATVTQGPSLKVIDRDLPQSIIIFGSNGIKRSDPDFLPAYVMSEILGGGSFSSRLTSEIREKRGLTYGVYAGLNPMRRAGLFLGSMGTRNEKAGEALDLIRKELRRMADEGPTQQELDEAKTYLTGSYALRFGSNNAIASQLLGLQQESLGLDYIEKRNSRIDAITLDDVKAQAKRLLQADNLIVAIVGRPVGLVQ